MKFWPIALVVLSNTFFQICTKSVPSSMNPLASLSVTYLIGSFVSAILYYALNRDANLLQEFTHLNWAPFLLGVVVVGLEVGTIYAYRVGWTISTAQVVQSSLVAVILIVVGYLLYREAITWNKVLGVAICMVGLYFINKQS